MGTKRYLKKALKDTIPENRTYRRRVLVPFWLHMRCNGYRSQWQRHFGLEIDHKLFDSCGYLGAYQRVGPSGELSTWLDLTDDGSGELLLSEGMSFDFYVRAVDNIFLII